MLTVEAPTEPLLLEIEQLLLSTDWDEWTRQDAEEDRFHLATATDSRTLPDLPNKPNKTNWVEKAGGLPSYIKRIAKHLHSEKGMDVSRAIAVAVNTVKRWCSSGTITEGGKGNSGKGVTAKTKALACKAVAAWEAKKKAGKSLSVDWGDEEPVLEYEGVMLSVSDAAFIDQLTADRATLETEIDEGAYALVLTAARQEQGLDLAVFNENLHPRLHGKFIAKGAMGDEAHVGIEPFQDGKHNLTISHDFAEASVALKKHERKALARSIRHEDAGRIKIHDDAEVHLEYGSDPHHSNIHIKHAFGEAAAEFPRKDKDKLANLIEHGHVDGPQEPPGPPRPANQTSFEKGKAHELHPVTGEVRPIHTMDEYKAGVQHPWQEPGPQHGTETHRARQKAKGRLERLGRPTSANDMPKSKPKAGDPGFKTEADYVDAEEQASVHPSVQAEINKLVDEGVTPHHDNAALLLHQSNISTTNLRKLATSSNEWATAAQRALARRHGA